MLILDGLVTLLPVTLSSLSIALVLLVLLGRHGLVAASLLVLGWFVGAWVVLLLGMLGIDGLASGSGGTGGLPPGVQIGLGLVAVVLGVGLLVRRRRRPDGASADLARLARLADGLTPVRSAGLGLALVAASPRQWLFLVPAAALLAAADAPAGLVWLPVLGAVVATVGVLAPVLLAALAERRDPALLPRMRRWWTREGDTVGALASLLVGVVLVVLGVSAAG
jgi:MYXO-CTERM domain-containing protein